MLTRICDRPSSRFFCAIQKIVNCCTDPTDMEKRHTTLMCPSRRLYWDKYSGLVSPYLVKIARRSLMSWSFRCIGRLNTNEDNENMLGYDLYSSALADMLSEPSLSMPITVGLYAKWGSGKSFLLSKLRGIKLKDGI